MVWEKTLTVDHPPEELTKEVFNEFSFSERWRWGNRNLIENVVMPVVFACISFALFLYVKKAKRREA